MIDLKNYTPEESVFGGIFAHLNAIDRVVATGLKAEEFEDLELAEIYSVCIDLYDAGKRVDILSVAQELRKKESKIGVLKISELSQNFLGINNLEYYAVLIRQNHVRRKTKQLAASLMMSAGDETKDIFELHAANEAAFQSLFSSLNVGNALAISDLAGDFIAELEQVHRSGKPKGLVTGRTYWDQMTGSYQEEKLYILAGRPAMGKTADALHDARVMAANGHPGVFFSLEMGASELMNRMAASVSGISGSDASRGRLNSDQLEHFAMAVAQIADLPIYVDDTPSIDIDQMRIMAKQYKRKYGIKWMIVDYLQLIEVSGRKTLNERAGEISRKLKLISKECKIPVIALSQLSRAVEQRGGDKRPIMSDLRDSGSIEQDADVVTFVYRPEYYGIMQYEDGSSTKGVLEKLIRKQRGGPTGDILEYIDLATGRITNYDYEGGNDMPF